MSEQGSSGFDQYSHLMRVEELFGYADGSCDDIVGNPVGLDPEAGGIAYTIETVVDEDGRHTVQYASPDQS